VLLGWTLLKLYCYGDDLYSFVHIPVAEWYLSARCIRRSASDVWS